MTSIKLDPKKLLGFRIVAGSGSAAKLHSPKIGAKGCIVTAADAVPSTTDRASKI